MSKYIPIIAGIIAGIAIASYAVMSYNGQTYEQGEIESVWPNVHENVITSFTPTVSTPVVHESASIHPFGVVIGACHIGKMVLVAPTAVCRGDEGIPLKIGELTNLQDGVVLHALVTEYDGINVDNRRFSADGERLMGDNPEFKDGYAIWIGKRTSLAHGAMVHGPAWVGDDTFVGFESTIYNAKVGNDVAIGFHALVAGVEIPDNKFVPSGAIVATQEQADALPSRIGSEFESLNAAVVDVNEQLAAKYNEMDLAEFSRLRDIATETVMYEISQISLE